MLTGLNHVTLAVHNVPRALAFYRDQLGFHLDAQWDAGAYLSLGELWLCLSQAPGPLAPATTYTHYAFSIAPADFTVFCARLRAAGVIEWKTNHSEGNSFYFLDPDGHQLEAHVGTLASRLAACRERPYKGMQFFDQAMRPTTNE